MGIRAASWMLLAVVLLGGCQARRDEQQQPPQAPATAAVPPPSNPVLEAPPEKLRQALAAAYRLQPDRRFLLAVADVHHFLTGQPKQTATAEWREGQWHIRYAGHSVGTVPGLADFGPLMEMLRNWAELLSRQHPLTLAPGGGSKQFQWEYHDREGFTPVSVLLWLDEEWNKGARSVEMLTLGARLLPFLVVQTLDQVETADAVPARAAAVLALAGALASFPGPREEALLARTMGYSRHAEMRAAVLPAADEVRLYVTRDDRRLMNAAQQQDATAMTRFLWLLRTAEMRDEKGWREAEGLARPRLGSLLPLLKTALELGRFDTNAIYSQAAPEMVRRELARRLGKPVRVPSPAESSLRALFGIRAAPQPPAPPEQVETDLEALASRPLGPFFDADVCRAYYRGYLLSGLYTEGLHYLDSLSSVDAVRQFTASLGGARSGTAADFRRWYEHLAKFKEGQADPKILLDDLALYPALGAAPLLRSFDEMRGRSGWGDPVWSVAARRLAARMDSRPKHRLELATIAFHTLLDLPRTERLMRSAVEAGGPAGAHQQAWFARFSGDMPMLRSVASDATADPEARAAAINWLHEQNTLSGGGADLEYRRLLEQHPDRWSAIEDYVEHLEKRKDYAAMRAAAEAWLNEHDESEGLDYVAARTAVARAYYHEGRYQEGWQAVEPVIESMQAGAMGRGALLLDKLGRRREAEELARRALERYPDVLWVRTLLARLYWEWDRYPEAARTLQAAPYNVGVTEWHFEIAPEFAKAFAGRPDEQALEAFSALLAARLGHQELGRLANPLAKAGRNELAFRMVSQLRGSGIGHLVFVMRAYRHRKAWQGEAAAREWIRSQVPPPMRNPSSMFSFEEGEYSLLWDLIEDPAEGEHSEFVWLMRAAASVKMRPRADPHRQALLAHYRRPGASHYDAIGRYLLGLAPEKEALVHATDAKKRCEIAYYIGLRALSEGRHADASDWFRIAFETGRITDGEYRWAYDTLYLWHQEGKSLALVAGGNKPPKHEGTKND